MYCKQNSCHCIDMFLEKNSDLIQKGKILGKWCSMQAIESMIVEKRMVYQPWVVFTHSFISPYFQFLGFPTSFEFSGRKTNVGRMVLTFVDGLLCFALESHLNINPAVYCNSRPWEQTVVSGCLKCYLSTEFFFIRYSSTFILQKQSTCTLGAYYSVG